MFVTDSWLLLRHHVVLLATLFPDFFVVHKIMVYLTANGILDAMKTGGVTDGNKGDHSTVPV